MAKVGTVLMDIQVEGAEATPSTPSAPSPSSTPKETQPQPSSSTEASSPAPTPTKLQGKVLATPAVRYLARKHQIDLSTIRGSGRDGRIHKEDILSVIQGGPTAKPQVPPSMPSIIITEQDRVVPLSGYSRIMAKTMAAAAHVPLFGYCDEIHMDSLLRLRQELKPIVEKRGIKFTYMPIIIKATSMALSKVSLEILSITLFL
jgi:2-oxoisovalerate dehydrogenase E2 component (dihydrolipoyl transacylase)